MQGRSGAANFDEHLVDLGHPGEHAGAGIVVSDVRLDRGDQVPHMAEHPASQTTGGQVTKPAFNEIQPGTAGGDEVEVEPGVACEPTPHRGMRMRGVVIHDEVQRPGLRGLLVEQLQKPQPFLMAMPRLTGADQLACEGGEQRRRAMPLVVMGHRGPAPLLQGQPGLSAIQGLDLALLVGAKDQGFVRRIEVEPHHIRQLFDELGIAADLEGAGLMRFEPMRVPDPMDGFRADADHGGQRTGRPVRGHRWRGRRGKGHDPLYSPRWDARRATAARSVLLDPGQPPLGEPAAPAPDAFAIGL